MNAALDDVMAQPIVIRRDAPVSVRRQLKKAKR